MKKVVFSILIGFAFSISNPDNTIAQEGEAMLLKTYENVDFSRYAGTWYEIARLPNRFQSNCAGDVTATYELLENGTLNVVNRCLKANGEWIEATGKARLANKYGPKSKLKVRFAPAFLSFIPFVWGNYWIIDLADDYSYAAIGEPDLKYFWVLSRKPELNDSTLRSILDRVEAQGYDLTNLVMTKQNHK